MMHCKLWDNMITYLLIIKTNGLWSVMMIPWQNSNGGTSLAHVVCQGLLILYFCSATQYAIDFCLQKQLDTELCHLVLCYTLNSC